MLTNWQSIRPILTAFGRLAGAVFVAYAFVVILIIASMQAHVADGLGRLNPALDYSTAYTMWVDSHDAETKIARLTKQRAEVQTAWEEAARREEEQDDSNSIEQAPLRELGKRLTRYPDCGFTLANPTAAEVADALDRARRCSQEVGLPPSIKANVDEVLEEANKIRAGKRDWLRYRRDVERLQKQAILIDREIAATHTLKGQLESGRRGFDAMSALRQRWMVGGAALTSLPPSVTQILLAFLSGMFGALLLTLVLIVYPNMTLPANQQRYGPRIMLGGLISLCVFVVLGGGTAVLGTASAFAEGEANFLAFCAICILAGMFSDRVAAWLSERADAFFKLEHARQGGNGEAQVPPIPQDNAGNGGAPAVP